MSTFPVHPDCSDLKALGGNRFDAVLRAEAMAVEAENTAERDRLQQLNELEEQQQDGRGMTRRTFVTGAAATATALATTQFVSTRASFAATKTGTLIHVFLYGGLDGLAMVAPADDPVLAKVRPDQLIPENGGIALQRGFRLTGAFEPLKKYLDARQLGFVPAVTDPRLSLSHFQAADACNLGGLPGETGGRGWLDSLVDALGPGTAFRSVGIGSTLPRSLVGTNGAIAMNSVGSFNLNGDQRFKAATAKAIKTLFTDINHPVQESVQEGLAALSLAQKLAADGYQPADGVEYQGIGNAFRQLAQLIKGGANVRVATVGMGGWDTHENQGTQGGYVFDHMNELARALAAFFDDLGPAAADVTVLVSSEFGRRVSQNGSGTDHGHGGVIALLSGKKLAGNLLGRWDGLEKLDGGNVPEYNNMFNVYGAVAQGRFGLTNAEVDKIFPRQKYAPVKLFA
ncbi:DUF1501 domain-containing protein [Asanoa iriomotensis]|uniref:DUF1501 domain-containing protein n=1 Tax=Asanoa iriomotensis TaxID=234613 RepID=A0ABQ4C6N0_9ACTN|nr:DUF1501 domain-containing protein [Asanoa iriomotensis]GIF58409.1 hypothetical protein Air01nite_45040 [Asanoa iriomotensis]